MSKKNLVGGIVLAGAAAAAAAAVVVAKKISDGKSEPEQPILLDLGETEATDVVLEEPDDSDPSQDEPESNDETEPEIEIEFVISENASVDPEPSQE